jgi:hypothetical protein
MIETKLRLTGAGAGARWKLPIRDGCRQRRRPRQEGAKPDRRLISVPMQYNWDTGIGEAKADRSLLNIQPVIPFSLSEEWVLISRTIFPLIDAG